MLRRTILSVMVVLLALTGMSALLAATPVYAQLDDSFEYDYDYYYDDTFTSNSSDEAASAFAALFTGGFLIAILFFTVIFYIYFAYTLMVIAKKVGEENSWMAWVPLLNTYLMIKIAGMPGWTILLFFIPIVNFVSFFYMIYLWMKIAERRGFESWLGLLWLLPVVNFILPGYLAWGEPKSGNAAPVAQPEETPMAETVQTVESEDTTAKQE